MDLNSSRLDTEKQRFINDKLDTDEDLKFDTMSLELKLMLLSKHEIPLVKNDKARE